MKFSLREIASLREIIAWYYRNRSNYSNVQKNTPSRVVTTTGKPSLTIQAPAEGIPAASGYSFGWVKCKVLRADFGEWKDTGETETIFSAAPETQLTEGLRLGWAVWDGSAYVLVSKLCGDERTFTPPNLLSNPGQGPA